MHLLSRGCNSVCNSMSNLPLSYNQTSHCATLRCTALCCCLHKQGAVQAQAPGGQKARHSRLPRQSVAYLHIFNNVNLPNSSSSCSSLQPACCLLRGTAMQQPPQLLTTAAVLALTLMAAALTTTAVHCSSSSSRGGSAQAATLAAVAHCCRTLTATVITAVMGGPRPF
jgi:hypothetical protein